MRWRQKAFAFALLGALPAAPTLRYLAQRHLTRTLPRSPDKIRSYTRNFVRHKSNIAIVYPCLAPATLFEFGAGWDLCSNIAMYCLGAGRQIAVDVERLARAELINGVITYYRTHGIDGMVRPPPGPVGGDFEGDLRRQFAIDYRAPQDAAAMADLPDGAVDVVVSTNTLEHIPPPAIARIMRECHRLCHSGSVLSLKIDYSDHYANADPTISKYNFLRYSSAEWRKYNPPMHYQNRLRHYDYRNIFAGAGFRIEEEERLVDAAGIELVRQLPLAGEFAAYPPEELAARGGWFVLRRG